jgi:endonuclease/exonuclease/phosphatase family metal-dependent hydrolase
MHFRLITYNIHKGIGGLDRRYNLDRIVDVLGHYRPDIVFLQEVDENVSRSKFDRQVGQLADRLAFPHSRNQATFSVQQGHYGNAILSRFPLGNSIDLDLRVSIKKPRRALITQASIPIDGETQSVQLCCTHLGLSGFERSVQIRRIVQHKTLQQFAVPCIIGGDFNDVWSEHGRKHLEPVGFQRAGKSIKTFPAAWPFLSLDGIYYRGHLRLVDSLAGRAEPSRTASDHLPLIADFALTH